MKKILSIIAAAIICSACMASCGDSSSNSSASTKTASSVSTSSTVDSSSQTSSATSSESTSENDKSQQVSLTIEVSDLLDNYATIDKGLKSEDIIPKSGKIIEGKSYDITDDMTAYDLLKKATDESNIKIDAEKTQYGMYVKSINGISAGSCGKTSGWMFQVNGKLSEVSADACKLKAGDKVEFFYICDYDKYVKSHSSETQKAS